MEVVCLRLCASQWLPKTIREKEPLSLTFRVLWPPRRKMCVNIFDVKQFFAGVAFFQNPSNCHQVNINPNCNPNWSKDSDSRHPRQQDACKHKTFLLFQVLKDFLCYYCVFTRLLNSWVWSWRLRFLRLCFFAKTSKFYLGSILSYANHLCSL